MDDPFVELGASIYLSKYKMERVWKLIENDSFDCPNMLILIENV